MQFQRVSLTQLLVDGPIELVREWVWYSLAIGRTKDATIDAVKNVVAGKVGEGFLIPIRMVRVFLEVRPDGVLVVFESKPLAPGTLEADGGRGQAAKLVKAFERVLEKGVPAPFPAQQAIAPIAAPFGGTLLVRVGRPVYGEVLAPRRGGTLLSYALFSLFCCALIAPVIVIYGFGALKDYERDGDPGDKKLVVAAMIVAGIVTVVAVVLALLFWLTS